MRRTHDEQLPLTPSVGAHPHSRELQRISEILDLHPEINEGVLTDVTRGKKSSVGREGLAAEQVIRAAIVKQMHQLSYEELCFHLEDSNAFRSFVRIRFGQRLKPKRLQANIKRIRPETWEIVNRILVQFAKDKNIETGRTTRTDTTGVEANIHPPTDSSLLWDCIRVVTRILLSVRATFAASSVPFHDHRRRAKRRAYDADFGRGKDRQRRRRRAYRDLLRLADIVHGYGVATCQWIGNTAGETPIEIMKLMVFRQELDHVLGLMTQVIDQTRRRVFEGQAVPAAEKLVSIFEPHADILVKGERDPLFGHKITLTAGQSSLVTDCVIEQGNPTDSSLVERTLQRQTEIYGRPPRQTSFDGGFASKDNLRIAKEQFGVEDVAFHKKCGLKISDMVKSAWVFRRLRNFRAGIEGIISTLKRAFGLDRCTWRSEQGFKAYVWSSVVSFNLLVLARHLRA